MNTLENAYIKFTCDQWQQFRQGIPLMLSEGELAQLRGHAEIVSLQEVESVYLPLSRLINMYVAATQELHHTTSQFLGNPCPKVPYLIAITGSVAVGKSTTSRILRTLLARWPNHPRVDIVTTDGFLLPNVQLEKQHLMKKKGFPESHNNQNLNDFISQLKSGKARLSVPMYSHHYYDILPEKFNVVDQPDIVIIEGVNILQAECRRLFDFILYVDAKTDVIKSWYIKRFMTFYRKAKNDPSAFLHRFAHLSEAAAACIAENVWSEINAVNLVTHILPYQHRSNLILKKQEDHAVDSILLRKL